VIPSPHILELQRVFEAHARRQDTSLLFYIDGDPEFAEGPRRTAAPPPGSKPIARMPRSGRAPKPLRAAVLAATLLCSACAGAPDPVAPPAVPTPSIALAPLIQQTPGQQPTPAPTSTPGAKSGSWHGSGPEPKRQRRGKHGNYDPNAPKRSLHRAKAEPTQTEPTPAPSDRPLYWPLEHLNDQ
jgi:hypothetical protein